MAPDLSESEQTADDTSSTVTAEADEAASEAIGDATPAADDVDSVVTKAAQALNVDETQVRSTIDSVKTFISDNKIPTALGLLLLLLILWLIARRSNREVTWDEAVKNLDKADGKQAAAAVFAPQVLEDVSVSSFSDEQAADDKTAAELIEQADMFVGYADYVQAKSSLEQARVMEPANSLVAYKTLFVLYKLNQSDEFVELAEQTEFESDSLEWSEISEWGRELAPEHALFKEQTQTADVDDEVLDTADSDFNDVAAATELETENTDDEFELNLDLDADTTEKAADAEEADSGHIEFDLDDFAASKTADEDEVSAALPEQDTEQTPTQEVDDDLLSFDTSFTRVDSDSDESLNIDINNTDEFDSTASFDSELEPVADDDNFELDAVEISAGNDTADLEFDIGDLDDIDEAETKLDLAAAYVDMGDPDGARSILSEVLDEGSDEQKQRANELLSSLG
jgi:pilus assembly protein FimV